MPKKSLMRMLVIVFGLSLVLFSGTLCEATIYYVDADLNNTTIGGDAPEVGVNYTTSSSIGDGTDGFWHYRNKGSDYASNAYSWETDSANGSDTENTAPLIISVTLPMPGEYAIYALAEMSNARWDVACSFDGGNTYVIGKQESSYYDGAYSVRNLPVVTTDGSLIGKYVGLFNAGTVVTTTANEVVQVYVQGLAPGTYWDQRTTFDGLAYEEVPEPVTVCLLGLGGLLLRRKRA